MFPLSSRLSSTGVSHIKGTFLNLLSLKRALKPISPILPKPMCSCLSLPDPKSNFESLQ